LAVFAALVAGGVWWKAQPSEQQKVWHMQTLMPGELPPPGRAHLYETRTQRSIEDAADGDCRQAGNKLRSASASDPDDYWLSYYEGMAWVCDGDGERALEAFAKVDAATTDVPWGFTWWYGQALLLDLRVDEGLQVLDSLGASNHPRADDARQLAARVRNAY
jgi:predicted Zn-dependent protease